MKKIPAFFAALLITGVVGLVMIGIGGSAFMNTKTLPIQNSQNTTAIVTPTAQAQNVMVSAPVDQTQTQAQTQAELAAYKAQLDQAIQRINDANSQIQSLQSQLDQANAAINAATATTQNYQNILLQLQQRGLITIGSDGSITLRARARN